MSTLARSFGVGSGACFTQVAPGAAEAVAPKAISVRATGMVSAIISRFMYALPSTMGPVQLVVRRDTSSFAAPWSRSQGRTAP